MVHNLGKLSKAKKHKQYFDKNKDILKLDKHDRVKIGKGYLEVVSSTLKSNLYNTIKKTFT